MKERKKVLAVFMTAALIIAVISLGCGHLLQRIDDTDDDCRGVGAMVRRALTGNAEFVLLIDPGHGGMDGGASSADGTLEKDINLAIAEYLAAEAQEYDCSAILTRERDEWLCDTDEGSIRSRKTADLKARRDMIRKYSPDITVSIHLNSFREDPEVRGAQVFCPDNGAVGDSVQKSRELAEILQESLNETLQPDAPRTAMTRDGVFIFKEVEHPVVIVECGFLSNAGDADKLVTEEYQKELAQCIMTGIADFSGLKKPVNVEIVDSVRL